MRLRSVVPVLLISATASAQENRFVRPSQDAELWISGAVELRFDEQAKKRMKKAKDGKLSGDELRKAEERADKARRSFKNRFRLYEELGYRGNENLTSSKLFYTVTGFRYRLHKYARFTLEHRYNFRDRYSVNTHRVDVQFDSDQKLGRFTADYRLVFQHEFVAPIRYREILRHRFRLTARTRGFPIDPYVSAETFTALHHTGNKLIGLRYGAGAEWAIDNDHIVDLSIRHDREQNLPDLKYRWILGVAYEFQWRQ